VTSDQPDTPFTTDLAGPTGEARFGGGWIGYLGFPAADGFLPIPPSGEPRRLPSSWFGYCDHVLRRDRATGRWSFEALVMSGQEQLLEQRLAELCRRAGTPGRSRCRDHHRPEPVHGQATPVTHDGRGLLTGLPRPFLAGRYHSLIVAEGTLPRDLNVTTRGPGGIPMGRRYATHSTEGVQFHPESILTPHAAPSSATSSRPSAERRECTPGRPCTHSDVADSQYAFTKTFRENYCLREQVRLRSLHAVKRRATYS
jgi:hypothetical protein